ncbi:MAG TPA: nitrilase-related carbon-nitrogen hydrolase [Candidatus Binataceae bacterium]|nr:nitrilase-related carbon-nitrogen hydrolase [Candidatus Binataceae bacterium]
MASVPKIAEIQAVQSAPFLASPLGEALCIAISAVCFFIASRFIDMWPVALFAPMPMLAVAFAAPTRARAMLCAFVPIFIGTFGEWSAESFFLSTFVFVAIATAAGIIVGLLVLVARAAARLWNSWPAALVFPILYSALYFLLAYQYDGTWANPAYRMDTLRPLLQLASITGIWGIVFAMSLPASAVAFAWYRAGSGRPWLAATSVAIGAFALVMIFGLVRLATSVREPRVRVALIASDQKLGSWRSTDPTKAEDLLNFYASQVPKAAAQGAQVVVLPEKIVSATADDRDALKKILSDAAAASHLWIVAGINERDSASQINAAWIFSSDGSFVGEYHKHYFVRGFEAGYQAGESIFTFDAPWGKTGVAICKDLDYPWFIRGYGEKDIRLMLVPAWDWVGPNALMHERMSWVRGVENGFATARSAKTGYVTAHCAYGSSLASRSTFEEDPAIVVADVPIGPGTTLYTKFGDWFGWLAIAASIAIIVAVFRPRSSA